MTPVFFYHLERQPLEAVLPKMLSTSLDRGWRVSVQAGSEERTEALAALLWTFDDDSFLPHSRSVDEGSRDEERRLLYVGITRAMEDLTLTWCHSRKRYGDKMPCMPSSFF